MKTVDVRLREWEVIRPDRDDRYGLRRVSLDSDGDRAAALELARARVLEVTELREGLAIRAFAHVGRLQLGNVVITIEPKLSPDDLLALLRYAYELRNLKLFAATEFAAGGQLLQDLIAAQLFTEARELIERGVARRYVPISETVATPRGRIDLERLARRMPLVSATLPCRHVPRSADHPLNRVILSGLLLAATIVRDPRLRILLSRLAATMATEVTPTRLDAVELRRADDYLDRMTSSYSAALQLIKILFASSSVALEGEPEVAIRGFLFDMNRFFQALVGRLLRDHLPDLEVREERSLSGMLRYSPMFNPRARRAPIPRPDFTLAIRNRTVVLLDAKYRDLWNESLPREMLYQLAMYAMSQHDAATAAIIYPTSAPDATEAVIEIKAPHDGTVLGYVALRPLVLPRLVATLRRDSPDATRNMVRALAFGAAQHSGRS